MSIPSLSSANYSTGTGSSVTSISWSHTLLSGEFKKVFVVFMYENSASVEIASMTYGGVSMHIAAQHREVDSYGQLVVIAYLDDDEITVGANTVYCSVNNSGNMNGAAFLVTGAKQGPMSTPVEVGVQDLTQVTGSLPVNTDQVRMIDAVNAGATRTFTAYAGQSVIQTLEHTYFSAQVGTLANVSSKPTGITTGWNVDSSVNRLAYCAVAVEPAKAGSLASFAG
jgi:hypothetical protein